MRFFKCHFVCRHCQRIISIIAVAKFTPIKGLLYAFNSASNNLMLAKMFITSLNHDLHTAMSSQVFY